MKAKVLFVDDDPNILEAFLRNLRRYYDVVTASNGDEGISKLLASVPFHVVVSDLRMPGMNGIEFLLKSKEKMPETIRMMLTGNADLEAAMESVNKGNIFRLLIKPCSVDILRGAIDDGIKQYNLVKSEKELLEKTLLGSVKMLTDVLSLVNPIAFGRSSRVKNCASKIITHMNLTDRWKYEMAAMLSQVGCVTIPTKVLEKAYAGMDLREEEEKMFENHPAIAYSIIKNIPRLEEIAEIIARQSNTFGENAKLDDSSSDNGIRTGCNLLRIALDYDTLEASGLPMNRIIETLEQKAENYNPEMLQALKSTIRIGYSVIEVKVQDIMIGMVLDEDIQNVDGVLLIAKGQEITETSKQRLRNHISTVGLHKETVMVRVQGSFEKEHKFG